jgi:DNA-binding response OmpR family regulator
MSKSRHILVVDDDPEIVAMLATRMAHRGYKVSSAASGPEAVAAVRKARPELVLLDVMMPGMSGWEVARTLKADPATAGVKIIMVTAIGSAVNDATSPLYGADDHIDKPFEFADLERKIDALLG